MSYSLIEVNRGNYLLYNYLFKIVESLPPSSDNLPLANYLPTLDFQVGYFNSYDLLYLLNFHCLFLYSW